MSKYYAKEMPPPLSASFSGQYTLWQSVAYGAGSGLGWMLAIMAVGGIRERIEKSVMLPKGLVGPGITLIITGLMALAFTAFSGMIQIQ